MKRRKRSKREKTQQIIILIVAAIIVMVITLGIYILYRYHQSREQKMTEDGWINVELQYIGSAKTDYMDEHGFHVDNEDYIRTEGELKYIYHDYYFLYHYSHYQTENRWFKFYDLDFDPQVAMEEEDCYYVFSIGRKLEWLQYKPDEVSQFGGVLNRAGKEWDAEIEDDMAYFYKFEYSGKHHLADVSIEF